MSQGEMQESSRRLSSRVLQKRDLEAKRWCYSSSWVSHLEGRRITGGSSASRQTDKSSGCVCVCVDTAHRNSLRNSSRSRSSPRCSQAKGKVSSARPEEELQTCLKDQIGSGSRLVLHVGKNDLRGRTRSCCTRAREQAARAPRQSTSVSASTPWRR
jgi:hypothetical protein